MYRPKHRAAVRRRPTVNRASVAGVGAVTLAMAAVFGPSAYADTGWDFTNPAGHGKPGKNKPHKPEHPGQPDKGKPDKPEHDDDHASGMSGGPVTNGGKSLPGDSGISLAALKPTAQPITPYEIPFPCNEVWTGSSRAGHSPS